MISRRGKSSARRRAAPAARPARLRARLRRGVPGRLSAGLRRSPGPALSSLARRHPRPGPLGLERWMVDRLSGAAVLSSGLRLRRRAAARRHPRRAVGSRGVSRAALARLSGAGRDGLDRARTPAGQRMAGAAGCLRRADAVALARAGQRRRGRDSRRDGARPPGVERAAAPGRRAPALVPRRRISCPRVRAADRRYRAHASRAPARRGHPRRAGRAERPWTAHADRSGAALARGGRAGHELLDGPAAGAPGRHAGAGVGHADPVGAR